MRASYSTEVLPRSGKGASWLLKERKGESERTSVAAVGRQCESLVADAGGLVAVLSFRLAFNFKGGGQTWELL